MFDFICVGMNFTVTLTLNYFELNIEERLMRNIDNIVCYVYWREMCYVYWYEMYFDIDIELSEMS